MSVKTKIWLLVGILLVSQFIMFVINNNSFSIILDKEKQMDERYIPNMKDIGIYATKFMEARKIVAEYLAFNDENLKLKAENKMQEVVDNISS
jgi:methyl-accepting chemotaxis protein